LALVCVRRLWNPGRWLIQSLHWRIKSLRAWQLVGSANQSSARQLIQRLMQKMSKADAILGVSLLLLGVGGVALVNEGLRQQQVQRKLEYQRLDEQGLSKEDITHCSNKLPGPRVDRN
jgi:hypothetical protein